MGLNALVLPLSSLALLCKVGVEDRLARVVSGSFADMCCGKRQNVFTNSLHVLSRWYARKSLAHRL
jgi:hypothetical protein